ncbi:phosphoribosylanthranilate isomerase, partial [Candidatus Bathyarchaeota archaeon]|nr:phosphoribosylanthranilate isomerase [Candidatus Bathyarchaeota archaeon]
GGSGLSHVRVKICGITSLKDLNMVVEAGADAVGFVIGVPQSPRNLSFDEAERLIKATPVFVETVAVTVHTSLKNLKKIYEKLNPDVIQVHDLRFNEKIRDALVNTRLIGAVQAESESAISAAVDLSKTFDAVLADSHVHGMFGGTGKTHNWSLSRRIRDVIQPKPLILAGGLTPENVEESIRVVKPYAVDVSSGVEFHPGAKDRCRVLEFIERAKEVEVN